MKSLRYRSRLFVFLHILVIFSLLLSSVPLAAAQPAGRSFATTSASADSAAVLSPAPATSDKATTTVRPDPIQDRGEDVSGQAPASSTPPSVVTPTPPPDPDEVVITPQVGGVLQSANGRVRLEFPPGAVAQRTVVRHRPVPPDASTPPELFYLCDLTATVEDSGTPLTTFARPVTFTVSYGPADTARRPGAALTLYWFDPAAGRWVPLPSQVSAQAVTATTSHFTLFAAGASGPGYGKDVLPTLRGFASDLWTGAATLQLPFTLPSGPAGFDLGLSLGYNSQGINELVQSAGQGSPSQYLAQGSWAAWGRSPAP